MQKFLNTFISALIALAFCFCSYLVALFLPLQKVNPQLLYFIITCLILLLATCLVLNLSSSFKRSKFINGLTPTKREELFNKKKQELINQGENAQKLVYKSINRLFAYNLFLVLAMFAICFLLGFSKFNQKASIVFIILFWFLSTGLISQLFFIDTPVKLKKTEYVNQNDYPFLFEIINNAGKTVGFNKKLQVVLSNGTIGISTITGKVLINLNAEAVALLNEDELYAVLLHEFAHYKNFDLKRRRRFYNQLRLHDQDLNYFSSFSTLFNSCLKNDLIDKINLFEIVNSQKIESQADNFVYEQGQSQNFINAMAKIVLLSLYNDYAWKEVTFDIYKEEAPVTDYSERNYQCFLQKVALYGDKWHFTLQNELTSENSSHPNFKQRMQNAKVSEYFVDFNITNQTLKQEQQKLLKKSSLLSLESFTSKKVDYLQIRQIAYTDRVNCIKKYENAVASWQTLSDSELIECAQAYLFIDDKMAESILTDVVSRTNMSFACYILGCLYARYYNDKCIELFKKAATDSSATTESLSQLALYALKTGNAELYEECKNSSAQKVEYAQEFIEETEFSTEGLTPAHEIYHADLKEITSTLINYWQSGANGIYVAVRETQSQTLVYYIAIDINKRTPIKKTQIAYEESCFFINRLSCVGKKFYIFFTGEEFKIIKNMQGSCVYKRTKK